MGVYILALILIYDCMYGKKKPHTFTKKGSVSQVLDAPQGSQKGLCSTQLHEVVAAIEFCPLLKIYPPSSLFGGNCKVRMVLCISCPQKIIPHLLCQRAAVKTDGLSFLLRLCSTNTDPPI